MPAPLVYSERFSARLSGNSLRIDKVAYANLWNIPVYQGTASHSLLMNEIIFTIGFTYDGVSRR